MPPKASLFKRPAWAQKTSEKAESPDTVVTSTNLFSRSDNFDAVVADRDRKKREKAEKKKIKDEKKAKDEPRRKLSDIQLDSPDVRSGKKRRISDEGDGGAPAPLSRRSTGSRRDLSPVELEYEDSISRKYDQVPSPTKPATRSSRRNEPTVIELDSGNDSDDDDIPVSSSIQPFARQSARHQVPQATAGAQHQSEPDSESDPELAQIKRRARQRAREQEKADEERQKASRTWDAYTETYVETLPTLPHDPKIQILVTSPIPGTTPLIVSRKLSQRLQEVKDAWFGRQNLPPTITSETIFFTYRLRKLYNVTTGKSLGIKVDGEGRIIPDDRSYLEEDETGIGGQHQGKVHLEAVTEELWHKMREARRNGRTGSSMQNKAGTEGTPTEGDGGEAEQEPIIKITMKAKGFKDIKMKVKPSTPFSKISTAARRLFSEQTPIGDDQKIILAFDGEPLEPEDGQIKDTEIENMDSIEVWIK